MHDKRDRKGRLPAQDRGTAHIVDRIDLLGGIHLDLTADKLAETRAVFTRDIALKRLGEG